MDPWAAGHRRGRRYETVNPYLACSGDTSEGFCRAPAALADAGTCTPLSTARDCATFGEPCTALDHYPNASVTAYGVVSGEADILREVHDHGPVACSIAAEPILDYTGGIASSRQRGIIDHVVSIVGYGVEDGVPYWHVRNSWGESWGEMGFFRIERGTNQAWIESECAWATPGAFSSTNFPCSESGDNCRYPLPPSPPPTRALTRAESEGEPRAEGVLAPPT